jgi:hypothetical protein
MMKKKVSHWNAFVYFAHKESASGKTQQFLKVDDPLTRPRKISILNSLV